MNVKYIGGEGVDWFYLVQDKDQLRALLNMVMNSRIS